MSCVILVRSEHQMQPSDSFQCSSAPHVLSTITYSIYANRASHYHTFCNFHKNWNIFSQRSLSFNDYSIDIEAKLWMK